MESAFREWLAKDANDSIDPSTEEWIRLARRLSKSYTIYGQLLILRSSIAADQTWQLLMTRRLDKGGMGRVLELIAKHMHVSHIAISQPISLHDSHNNENVLRAPLNFEPVYGDFGPAISQDPPAPSDFDRAFWATAKQNGIYQAWAPRWTMFSRGNVGEKGRILNLPSVRDAVQQGERDGRGCAAVDLFAGIGYFAFSYAKAGFQTILCWDLNPWSCEGLRRGAMANKWSSMTWSATGPVVEGWHPATTFMIFNESNENAFSRLEALRYRLPPIRHVNCGLLPTSAMSWGIALDVLDAGLGGWVHVHENFATHLIEQKANEVQQAFQQHAANSNAPRIVKLEHIQRVKTYAPGIWHCVLDLYVAPAEIAHC